MASKRQIAGWIKTLEKRKEAIGKERDKLRDFISEVEELAETCDRAHEDLTSAIDSLSCLV
jgi:hypothetical protein